MNSHAHGCSRVGFCVLFNICMKPLVGGSWLQYHQYVMMHSCILPSKTRPSILLSSELVCRGWIKTKSNPCKTEMLFVDYQKWPFLGWNYLTTMIHALITLQINHCNAFYIGGHLEATVDPKCNGPLANCW